MHAFSNSVNSKLLKSSPSDYNWGPKKDSKFEKDMNKNNLKTTSSHELHCYNVWDYYTCIQR